MRRICFTLFVSILSLLLVAPVIAQDDVIIVGSKSVTEQLVLGQLIIIALEDAGFEVVDRTGLGETAENRQALVNGDIDVYPNFTGTAITNWYRDYDWIKIPPVTERTYLEAFALASSLDAALFDLVWLTAAPMNNTYAFSVTAQFAEEHNIHTVTDFAAYVNDGGEVMLATGDEFAVRRDGLEAFEVVYGFELRPDQMIVITGATPTQTNEALNNGRGGVNVAMAYSTTGVLPEYGLVVLEDNLNAQPVYAPAPVFRGEVMRTNPEIAGILNPIYSSLSNDTMQELNRQVDIEGLTPEDVARTYLVEQGFIDQ